MSTKKLRVVPEAVFSKWLRETMERENLRIRDLSLLMGVTRKTIHEWLRGNGPLHPNHVKAQLIQKMNEIKGRELKPTEDLWKRGEIPIPLHPSISNAVTGRLAHLPLGHRERFQERVREITARIQRELDEFLGLLEAEYRLERGKRREKKH
jgi:transcriptional regulator with XRE-family HTH domain